MNTPLKTFLILGIFFAPTLHASEWHVKIIAKNQAENLIDRGTVIGELTTSTNQIDKHDLPEMEPFAAPYLTVVFKKSVDGEMLEFNSDFRKLDTASIRIEKQWLFTVKSDDPTRDVTLKWEGSGRLDRMVMVDLDAGLEFYPVIGGRAQVYNFNMNGKTEREFLWKY